MKRYWRRGVCKEKWGNKLAGGGLIERRSGNRGMAIGGDKERGIWGLALGDQKNHLWRRRRLIWQERKCGTG